MIQEVLTRQAPVTVYTEHFQADLLDRIYDAKRNHRQDRELLALAFMYTMLPGGIPGDVAGTLPILHPIRNSNQEYPGERTFR